MISLSAATSIFVALVLICLFFWALRAIMVVFSISHPASGLVNVVAVIVIVLFLLQAFNLLSVR